MSNHPHKALLFPALAGFTPAVGDVAEIPEGATSARLVQDVRNFHELSSRVRLAKLWCFGIDETRLRTIASCESLTNLFIDGVRVDDLSLLGRLRKLESLSLEGAPKIRSLDWVREFDHLKGLALLDFRAVNQLGPLADLAQLRALAVAGSMWTRMTVESLSPLSTLTALKFLHLTNLKPLDRSLEPLRRLSALEELECANFYPMEEFASLAAALPHTTCSWFTPFVPFPSIPCKKCGQTRLVLRTGMPTATLCLACDQARVRKHEAAFGAIAR
jgi:hypothetical protein